MSHLFVRRLGPCALALAAGISSASAQLVVGTTTPTTSNPAATIIDPVALTGSVLWNSAANKKVNGLAADAANSRLYCNDAARLNFWNYGSVGTTPTFIAGMYRTTDNVTFTATGCNDLTWANGNLYGCVASGTSVFGRGIYRINTTSDGMATPHCVMTPAWIDPTFTPGTANSQVNPFGLEYNPANNLFYFTNESVSAAYQIGVYTVDVFGGGPPIFLTAFPAGASTHVDGLTIGGGKMWLTQQNPTGNEVLIYPWDLTTQTYNTTLSLALTDGTQRASAAVWAPGANVPASGAVGLIALGGLAAMRRRR